VGGLCNASVSLYNLSKNNVPVLNYLHQPFCVISPLCVIYEEEELFGRFNNAGSAANLKRE
jgi:hypothetical protein